MAKLSITISDLSGSFYWDLMWHFSRQTYLPSTNNWIQLPGHWLSTSEKTICKMFFWIPNLFELFIDKSIVWHSYTSTDWYWNTHLVTQRKLTQWNSDTWNWRQSLTLKYKCSTWEIAVQRASYPTTYYAFKRGQTRKDTLMCLR